MTPISDCYFTPLEQYQPGLLHQLLLQSYAPLLQSDPRYWTVEIDNWVQFDAAAFSQMQSIGRCILVTVLQDPTEPVVIGFGSFDPRQTPDSGRIGHNCILPAYQNQGYGQAQILETLRRLRRRGIRTALVSTSEHPFFIPAQRMYQVCGFVESDRHPGGPDPRYGIIEYRLDLI